MRSKPVIISIAFAALLACGTPTGGCACSPAQPETHFVGFVRHGNGQPVSNVAVNAWLFTRDCESLAPDDVYVENAKSVDATGRYGLTLATFRSDTFCARLVARTATDSVVRDSILVQVRDDSVRVDFTFP